MGGFGAHDAKQNLNVRNNSVCYQPSLESVYAEFMVAVREGQQQKKVESVAAQQS